MDANLACPDACPCSKAADRFLLAHIAELVRLGETRREFAAILRQQGVPFYEVDVARMFRDARRARVRFR